MNRLILALIILLLSLLAGCATPSSPQDDGYQFGDVSSSLLERQRTYCAETNPAARAVALALIRTQVPGYPASGLCSDAEQALAAELAKQLEALPEGATIDLEQAKRDQQRAREQQGAKQATEAPAP